MERFLWEGIVRSPEFRKKTLELARKFSVTTTQDFSSAFCGYDGPYVITTDGEKLLDFSCSAGSMNFAHGNRSVMDALARQFELLDQLSDQDWVNPTTTLLKVRLDGITPGNFKKKVFFGNSGTEAVEAAIKLCLAKRPERRRFIAFQGAFHGRTLGSLCLHGSKPVHREHFPTDDIDVIHLPFPVEGADDYGKSVCDALNEIRSQENGYQDINAIFIELVQGEGGINVASKGFVQILKIFCEEQDIYFVVDEVQTGFWRTGKLFACEHYGIEPDIICLGKSLGGILPVSAMICRADLDFDRSGRHSNTYGGYPLGAAAALSNLELMEKTVNVAEVEDRVMILKEFAPEGLGLMRRWRFETPELRNKFVAEAEHNGVQLLGSGPKNVRFMPPVNIDTQLFKDALETLSCIEIPHL